jgi:hypothetical protein
MADNTTDFKNILLSILLYVLKAISFLSNIVKKTADYGINKINSLKRR